MEYIIDRFEGDFAVCERPDKSMYHIQKNKLPSNCKEGSKIKLTDNGYILLDNSSDRDRIKSKMRNLFK